MTFNLWGFKKKSGDEAKGQKKKLRTSRRKENSVLHTNTYRTHAPGRMQNGCKFGVVLDGSDERSADR